MTWFHFCKVNHNRTGRSTLVDMADWFEAGLLDLGHKVTFSDTHVEQSAINVFWECFTKGMGAEIARSGVQYGIIATEIPDGYAFNWREELFWKERFDAFHEVARNAQFIWTMVESTVPFYSNFCSTAFMELGFSERLVPNYRNDKPQFDFCFFGLRTPYREEVVKKLKKHARVEWPEHFMTPKEIEVLIGNSKIGLNFKQSEKWPVPSPTRLGRLMMAKRAVAAEYVPVATRQGELAGICPEFSNFHEYALSILHSDWQRRAEMVFDAYREKMPMRIIMERVLEHTISGVEQVMQPRKISLKYILPPLFLKKEGIWNIFLWDDEYIALLRGFGPIDITLSRKELLKKYTKYQILYSYSLSELRIRLRHQTKNIKTIFQLIVNLINKLKNNIY